MNTQVYAILGSQFAGNSEGAFAGMQIWFYFSRVSID
jgi:hypothetical protein